MRNSTLVLILFLSALLSCNQDTKSNMDSMIYNYESLLKEFNTESQWPQFDEDVLAKKKDKLIVFLQEIENLDDTGLSGQDRINKDMLTLIVRDRVEALLTDDDRENKYLEKLEALPQYIDDRIGHLNAGMNRGVVSPKLITTLCLGMVDEVVNADPSQTFFVTPAKGTKIEDKVTNIVKTKIVPSYKKLSSFLVDNYMPKAQGEIGVRAIPGGEEYYEHRVRYFATDNISPKEVFDIGMAEVDRIKTEMEQIIKEVKFEGSFDDFQAFLRTSPQFYAKSPQEILNKAAWITKQMEGELPKYFGKLPMMPLTVKPVPAAIAPNYTSGRYSEGSYKNKKAGEYWVNTTKLESRPLYALPALSLHEGVPGHHTQIMLAAELDLPDFRRNTYLSAFGEGWALYCEYLGKEAGIYTTAYEDYGRLVYEMWRACRLVVDPGMHYLGWSRDKAFNFMKENTALSILEINNEVNRYIGWPAQAISYKLGELKIKELRKYAEAELGDLFEITSFHDAILSNGSVPLNTLERIIHQWVKEQKSRKEV